MDLSDYLAALRAVALHTGVDPGVLVMMQGVCDPPERSLGEPIHTLYAHLLLCARESEEITREELAELDLHRARHAEHVERMLEWGDMVVEVDDDHR